MVEAEAVRQALALRAELEIPDRELVSAAQGIVEWWPDPEHRGDREDRIAWVVRLGDEMGMTEIAIDDESAIVLSVRRFG